MCGVHKCAKQVDISDLQLFAMIGTAERQHVTIITPLSKNFSSHSFNVNFLHRFSNICKMTHGSTHRFRAHAQKRLAGTGGSKSHSTTCMWSIIAHTYKEPSLFSKPQIESTVIVRFRASKRRVHNCCSKMSRKDSTARFVVTARLLGPDQSTKKRGKV